jgi:hypothetical protein
MLFHNGVIATQVPAAAVTTVLQVRLKQADAWHQPSKP